MADVGNIAQQVLDAMKGAVGSLGPDELTALQQESKALAQCLADIAAERALGQLTDAQAADAVAGQAAASKAVLQAQLGIAELAANKVIKAGLGALATAALTAAGLGWASPIIQNVISGL